MATMDSGGPPPLPGGGGVQIADSLNLTASEATPFNNFMFSFDTFNAADEATTANLIDSQISGVARYTGNMLARTGTGSEFLRGDVRLLVGFQAGTFTGRVNGLQFAGADSAGRATIPDLDSLDMTEVSFNNSKITALLSGTFDEGGFLSLSAPVDQHTVDATVELTFVDANSGDGGTEYVGSIDGTITSANDGTRTLVGLSTGESGF